EVTSNEEVAGIQSFYEGRRGHKVYEGPQVPEGHGDGRMRGMADGFLPVAVTRVRDGARVDGGGRAATEGPLQVRLPGRPFAVIMRTPGADRELAAGFLLAEGVIRSADDLGTIEHCADSTAAGGNIVNVTMAGVAAESIDRVLGERRQVTTNSSCGLC